MPALAVRIVLFSLLLLSTLVPAAAFADTPCWTMLDAAITHRAEVALPPFLAYDVQRSVEDPRSYYDRPFITTQVVLLRTSDGMARIVNSLYGPQPMHTEILDPGFPFVGPSGPERDEWLADDKGQTIAVVHAHAGKACDDLGPETVDGRRTEHLHITPNGPNRPGMRDVWIGSDDGEIWRAVVAQPIDVSSITAYRGIALTDCTIDVIEEAGGAYVRSLAYRLDDLQLSVTYTFSNYRGLESAPPGSFPGQ